MYQVKLFAGTFIDQMQDEVNAWLSGHKDISVSQSCMNTIPATESEGAGFTIYFLYTTSEARAEELKELAAEVRPESSVEVTDINPDVLQATN